MDTNESPTSPSGNDPPAPPGTERRASPRVRADRPIQLRLVENPETPLNAHLLDVSAGGVGLRMSEELAVDQEFFLSLFDAVELASTPLRYRVVRCSMLVSGEYRIGASFIPTSGEARALLGILAPH
jgi:hypothetical protein